MTKTQTTGKTETSSKILGIWKTASMKKISILKSV